MKWPSRPIGNRRQEALKSISTVQLESAQAF
jgi:hypothetical protein